MSARARRLSTRLALCAVGLLLARIGGAVEPSSVAGTVHNLSVSGPGEFRALTETEVCKFCHVPHNAVVPVPLWGHTLSEVSYRTPEIRRGRADARPAPQPDGASRLCLSCHDGTVALGDVAGETRPLAMSGGRERLRPGDRGYLGTDLSGSHPVSFVVPDGRSADAAEDEDLGLRPLSMIQSDPDVRLDSEGKMQCTTCHDPHSDRHSVGGSVPRFWVKPTHDAVCLACHVPG